MYEKNHKTNQQKNEDFFVDQDQEKKAITFLVNFKGQFNAKVQNPHRENLLTL